MRKLVLLFSISCFLFSFAYASETKHPNVAGQFYPANPKELSQKIQYFLDNAELKKIDGEVLALISPHAGYDYSGAVAACGYKAIEGKHYDTVVVLGLSHHQDIQGVAIWPKGIFNTPLGDIPVDETLSKQLQELSFNIKENLPAFENEHSLEVQLPFLQTVLKDFKLVPLIMGGFHLSDCELLAHGLRMALEGKNALLVISTDMSHYHPYEVAVSMDKETLSYIKDIDPVGLYEAARKGGCELCGLGPVLTALYFAKEKGLDVQVLKYANSGDVTGDKSSVVGYSSIALYQSNIKEAKSEVGMLNKVQRKRLLEIARASIQEYLKTGKLLEVTESDAVLNTKKGAFVTLNEHGDLRGCIGNLVGEKPLYLTVRDMSVEAAVNDPRFSALSASELKDIEIEISVLSELEKISDPEKIELSKHGVLIRKGSRSGVFLPQVATETHWTREEFLSNLCTHKAGLSSDCWRDGSSDIYIFTAEVFNEKEY